MSPGLCRPNTTEHVVSEYQPPPAKMISENCSYVGHDPKFLGLCIALTNLTPHSKLAPGDEGHGDDSYHNKNVMTA